MAFGDRGADGGETLTPSSFSSCSGKEDPNLQWFKIIPLHYCFSLVGASRRQRGCSRRHLCLQLSRDARGRAGTAGGPAGTRSLCLVLLAPWPRRRRAASWPGMEGGLTGFWEARLETGLVSLPDSAVKPELQPDLRRGGPWAPLGLGGGACQRAECCISPPDSELVPQSFLLCNKQPPCGSGSCPLPGPGLPHSPVFPGCR